MVLTFKILSALLSYPDAALTEAVGEVREALRAEGLLDAAALGAMEPLLASLASDDLLDVQERYVDLFDKSRQLSLHLFEHVHGESRDRGQAMIDLAALYEKGGMTLATRELPDYLPLFLEYLSTRPLQDARETLADALPIIASIEARLDRRDPRYAAVFAAIRAASGVRAQAPAPHEAPAQSAAEELAALDAAWAETAVSFGPGESLDGCTVDRLKTQIRAGSRDARRAAI